MVIQILATSNQIIHVTHKSNQPTHLKLQSLTNPSIYTTNLIIKATT